MTKTSYRRLKIFSLLAIIPAAVFALLLTAAGATYFASTYASTGNDNVISTKISGFSAISQANQFDVEGSANPE